MTNVISKFKLLYDHQFYFSFREKHSILHALTTLVDRISKTLDPSDMMLGVSLDFNELDCVDHEILLRKLWS